MKRLVRLEPDPRYDLKLERIVDAPVALVWRACTEPELVKKWFVPAPWQVAECDIDLRPGGFFRSVMRGPEGQEIEGASCYLEIVPHERLVWTDALLPGYRPSPEPFFTAVILFEAVGDKTRYTALALHKNEEDRKQHEEMGFHEGWGAAADQLAALLEALQ